MTRSTRRSPVLKVTALVDGRLTLTRVVVPVLAMLPVPLPTSVTPLGARARVWVTPASVSFEAVAVLAPVAATAVCVPKLPSAEIPPRLGTTRLAMSKASVMPVGGVHVADVSKACAVVIIVFATVVVTLGASWVRALGVDRPVSISIGFVVSTPENDWMPPADPVDVPKVQLYGPASLAPATL